MWNASRFCVSSLRRGHANLLCIVPILVYVLPKQVHLHLLSSLKDATFEKELSSDLQTARLIQAHPPPTQLYSLIWYSCLFCIFPTYLPRKKAFGKKQKFWVWSYVLAILTSTLIGAVLLLIDMGSFECSVSRLFRFDPL